jgi:hypothetical protein
LTCPAGKFSSSTGATSVATCAACSAGYTTPVGSTSSAACVPIICNAGYTGPTGGPCAECTAGKYKETTGSAECDLCFRGKYSTATGATSVATCVRCPLDSVGQNFGDSSVMACWCYPGFAGPNGGPCLPCIGSWSSEYGSSTCTACPAGTYSNTSAAESPATCLTCPPNTFAPAGATACVSCGTGSTSPGAGDASSCVCEKGFRPQ